jgi:hypothetical protein
MILSTFEAMYGRTLYEHDDENSIEGNENGIYRVTTVLCGRLLYLVKRPKRKKKRKRKKFSTKYHYAPTDLIFKIASLPNNVVSHLHIFCDDSFLIHQYGKTYFDTRPLDQGGDELGEKPGSPCYAWSSKQVAHDMFIFHQDVVRTSMSSPPLSQPHTWPTGTSLEHIDRNYLALRLLWRMAGAPYIMGWDKFINEYSPSLV